MFAWHFWFVALADHGIGLPTFLAALGTSLDFLLGFLACRKCHYVQSH